MGNPVKREGGKYLTRQTADFRIQYKVFVRKEH